ncbi:HNH endonuclease [Lactococcus phage 936 group phage PhiJF1]|uniref:HNH endonuclease n=1 Tax=Lactococcus phage 936 group phage PhiJF1 TaxID=1636580 RepID=A0A126HCY7_9CAUD|nr:HNH endonuclease [Lactococcus phage 936 group phage PhiJF1]ALM64463.1 HNH endonuclease [Lactococcus phage 936 group phage PhiJF1]
MKDYKFYKNDYLVFSDGRVYSFKSHRYLKPSLNAYGYLKLKINGKNVPLHRIVMETFKGYSDLTVDHIDMNKLNNDISNLEYVTRSKSVVYDGKVFNSGAELCRKLGVERHAVSLVIRQNTRLKGHYVQFGNEVSNGI